MFHNIRGVHSKIKEKLTLEIQGSQVTKVARIVKNVYSI